MGIKKVLPNQDRPTHTPRQNRALIAGWLLVEMLVMKLIPRVKGLITGLIVANCLSLMGEDHWPAFRGAESRGVSQDTTLPLRWSQEENVLWKKALTGRGWSSPIVWDETLFLVGVSSQGETETPIKGLYFGGERPEPSSDIHTWRVEAIDTQSGQTQWVSLLHTGAPKTSIHVKNTYASETPVTDGEHVYVYFGYMGLYCLDMEGKTVWKKQWEPKKMRLGWGTSSSPILHEDLVIVVNDNEEQSWMAAFDKHTGEERWRIDRDEPSNFSTPFVWHNPIRTEIITTGVNQTRSYDIQGNPLWQFSGMSTICIPTPFADGDRLFLAAGYVGDKLRPNKPIYVLRPGASGDISLEEGQHQNTWIEWMASEAAPYNPSPLLYDNRLYVLWDFGFLSARDATDGKEIFPKERLHPRGRVGFTASPWAYRGHLFCLSEDGDTYVVESSDTFSVKHVNSLGEMCMATPAMSRGKLFIRTLEHLYCLSESTGINPQGQNNE
jgi:outer membrane protein assembly factor BamB